MDGSSLRATLKHFLRVIWNYSGTLAALSLLVGVLAMGFVHMGRGVERDPNVHFFRGIRNTADASAPEGVGELSPDQVVSTPQYMKFEYDGPRLKRVVAMDQDGGRAAPAGSPVAEQRLKYDEGRLVRKENYDTQGRLCADSSGVAVRAFDYDDAGRLTKTSFLNAAGHPVAPGVPGYAVEKRAYDDEGRLDSRSFFDTAGKPCVNRAGEQVLRFRYNTLGKVAGCANYIGGEPADNAYGVAEERRSYDERGRLSRVDFYDAAGKPSVSRKPGEGYASSVRRYDSRGNCSAVRYFDDAGRLSAENAMMYAERVRSYDGRGNPVYESYLADENRLCVPPSVGYAERMCNYDHADRLRREYFWDADGRPGRMPHAAGESPCYERRYEYNGDKSSVVSLYADGSTRLESR